MASDIPHATMDADSTRSVHHADGDAEELRIVFTHIDAADPQRPFAFGVYVDDDDMYAGAHSAWSDYNLETIV